MGTQKELKPAMANKLAEDFNLPPWQVYKAAYETNWATIKELRETLEDYKQNNVIDDIYNRAEELRVVLSEMMHSNDYTKVNFRIMYLKEDILKLKK